MSSDQISAEKMFEKVLELQEEVAKQREKVRELTDKKDREASLFQECDGTLHVVGNTATCDECSFTCNWLHQPAGHSTRRTESPSEPLEPDPLPVEPEEEKSAPERCGEPLELDPATGICRCTYCESQCCFDRAVSSGFFCTVEV